MQRSNLGGKHDMEKARGVLESTTPTSSNRSPSDEFGWNSTDQHLFTSTCRGRGGSWNGSRGNYRGGLGGSSFDTRPVERIQSFATSCGNLAQGFPGEHSTEEKDATAAFTKQMEKQQDDGIYTTDDDKEEVQMVKKATEKEEYKWNRNFEKDGPEQTKKYGGVEGDEEKQKDDFDAPITAASPKPVVVHSKVSFRDRWDLPCPCGADHKAQDCPQSIAGKDTSVDASKSAQKLPELVPPTEDPPQAINPTPSTSLDVASAVKLEEMVVKDDVKPNFDMQIHFKPKAISSISSKKKLQCGVCNRTFDYVSALEIHYRTHTGEKPFKCQFCGYRSARNSNLLSHLRHVHKEAAKRFKCDDCGKWCKSQFLLNRHRTNEHLVRNFFCKTCESGYSSQELLTAHNNRVHSSDQTFECRVCKEESFAHFGHLLKHCTKVHGMSPMDVWKEFSNETVQ